MQSKLRGLAVAIGVAALAVGGAQAQDAAPAAAQVTVHADTPQWQIDRHLYGQFAEHLGHGIYGGLWVGEHSSIPNTRGLRKDVVQALRELHVPVVRWPGGCFADGYHWRDGIGPRQKRPHTINGTWGNVIEPNAFGTHEFMDLAEQIGAEAYISLNVGSGSVQEARDWVEYMTSDADSSLANLRRRNGRQKPWKIAYLGVGNEAWGCGGSMRPEYYADLYRQYQTFLHSSAPLYASGPSGDDGHWTEVLMQQAGSVLGGLSLHRYTLVNGDFNNKGAATGFDEAAWARTLRNALDMDGTLRLHSDRMDQSDPARKVPLAVDEWGTWYDVEPGTNPGFLYQQNSLRDALVAAVTLNIFQAHGDRVKLANIAQMVNVLQAMILTDGPRMLRTPTYHVFEMYKVHQDARYLPVDISAPTYAVGPVSMPALSATASRDAAGSIHLSLVNLDPHHGANISVRVAGQGVAQAEGRVLTAPLMDAHNTFDTPDAVIPVPLKATAAEGGSLQISLPPMAVAVVEIR
jgi:alpha-N-arabinofuranosidase